LELQYDTLYEPLLIWNSKKCDSQPGSMIYVCLIWNSEQCDSLLGSMSYVQYGIQSNVTHYLALWAMSYLEFRAMWLTTWLYNLCSIWNSEQYDSPRGSIWNSEQCDSLLGSMSYVLSVIQSSSSHYLLNELCPIWNSEQCDSLPGSMSYVLCGVQSHVTHYFALWAMSYLEFREMWLTTWLYEVCPIWKSEKCDSLLGSMSYVLCGFQSNVTSMGYVLLEFRALWRKQMPSACYRTSEAHSESPVTAP